MTNISTTSVYCSTENLLNKDCTLNEAVFNENWKKYSDIDEKIPIQSRSIEAQNYEKITSEIINKKLDIFILKRDMEADRLIRNEMRAYREALVQNIKVNLLKSFWRLAYITFDTAKSSAGTGKTFAKLFTDVGAIEKIGATSKVLRSLTLTDSQFAINTKELEGKVKAVGLTGALEAIDSLGDPSKIAQALAKDILKKSLPSANITPEEIEILRTQHIKNNLLDEAIQESYSINLERKEKIKFLETEIIELEKQSIEWMDKEKARTAYKIQQACRDRLKETNTHPNPDESNQNHPSEDSNEDNEIEELDFSGEILSGQMMITLNYQQKNKTDPIESNSINYGEGILDIDHYNFKMATSYKDAYQGKVYRNGFGNFMGVIDPQTKSMHGTFRGENIGNTGEDSNYHFYFEGKYEAPLLTEFDEQRLRKYGNSIMWKGPMSITYTSTQCTPKFRGRDIISPKTNQTYLGEITINGSIGPKK